MRVSLVRFLVALIVALTFCSSPSLAQSEPYTYTPDERIGFAFYYLTSRVEPPYEDWILARPDYQKSRGNVRAHIMESERRRLRDGFAIYDPAIDLIPVRTKVDLTFMNNPKFVENGLNDPDASVKIMKITFPHIREGELYFPFFIGKMWIAFVPTGSDIGMTYTLSRAMYEKIEKEIGVTPDWDKKGVQAEIVLRPVKADGESPITIEGQSTWLMTGEIASLSLLNNSGDRVWDHISDWFIQKDEKELQHLYTR